MNHLDRLEAASIYIIREAFNRVDPLAMLWSIGKDSTTLLWLVKKAFLGRVPFSLIHLDTDMEMEEVYSFRDQLVKEWDLPFEAFSCPSEDEIDPTLPPNSRAAARKTEGLKELVQSRDYSGLLIGIRRDEQSLRAKERIFSPRSLTGQWDHKNQPAEFWDQYKTDFPDGVHLRIHPLLQWSELDIWRYIERENIPCCELYFSKNGKRYRSLGEKNITLPIESNAATIADIIKELEETKISEREGRTMDKETESSFEKLREQGYL